MNALSEYSGASGDTRKSSWFFPLAGLLLCVDAFGGPLRYYFAMYHMEMLLYLPKVLVLAVALFPFIGIRIESLSFSIPHSVLWVYYILLVSVAVAIYNSVALPAIAFMVVILAPFILGLIIPRPTRQELGWIMLAVALIWTITIAGIWADYFMDFPWNGAQLELYGKTVELSRSWRTFGVDRPAGFTRLSVAAAFYAGTLGIMLLMHCRRLPLRLLIIALTLATVFITTTKSALGALIVVMLFMLFKPVPALRTGIMVAAFTLAVYLPLSVPSGGLQIPLDREISDQLFTSFNVRLAGTWPDFYASVSHPIIGEGFGGIGTANKFHGGAFVNQYLDVADSFPLYLMGWFGFAAGTAIFLALAYFSVRLASLSDHWLRMTGIAGMFILIAGITMDVIESVAGGLVIGILASKGPYED